MKNIALLVLDSVDILTKEDAPSIFEILFSNKYLSAYKGAPNLFFPKIKPWLAKKDKDLKAFKNNINSVIYRLQKQGFF